MFDLLQQLFNEPEIKAKLKAVRDLVDMTPDGFLAVIVFLLIFIGRKMVSASPEWRKNGLRIGVAVFLLVIGYQWWRAEVFGKEQLPLAALKAFNAGGMVLAGVWIVLPILSFVLTHLRLALAAFFGYAGYDLIRTNDFSAEHLTEVAVWSVVTTTVVLFIAWLVDPIWDYIHAMLPRPKPRPNGEEQPAATENEASRPRRRREEPHLLPTAAPPPIDVVSAQVDVVSTSLELIPQTEVSLTEQQRRRGRIRLQVEMAYVMATPQLGSRLPRESFNQLLGRYLADHLPIEDVEENSRQLLLILQEQQKQVPGTQSAAALTAPTSAPTTFLLEELLRRVLDEQKQGGSDHPSNSHAGKHHGATPNDQILHN
jgi:hypothetical protein